LDEWTRAVELLDAYSRAASATTSSMSCSAAGSRFLLDQPTTTAGRHPTSDTFLDDITISRRHAQFRCVSGEFQVVDVGSLNGTYVNREPVDSAVLANGDEVQIGKFRLVFLTGPTTGDTESVTS
jgi:pSer/pThr/pTyr-binding forkhead associated (FHA) protein